MRRFSLTSALNQPTCHSEMTTGQSRLTNPAQIHARTVAQNSVKDQFGHILGAGRFLSGQAPGDTPRITGAPSLPSRHARPAPASCCPRSGMADRRAGQVAPGPGCGDRHAAWPADTGRRAGQAACRVAAAAAPPPGPDRPHPGKPITGWITPSGTHNAPFGRGSDLPADYEFPAQIGGSARGYQAIFMSLAALSSTTTGPMSGQPAVYLYIAASEANVLNCRIARANSGGISPAAAGPLVRSIDGHLARWRLPDSHATPSRRPASGYAGQRHHAQ
jgi:hypothetical protein